VSTLLSLPLLLDLLLLLCRACLLLRTSLGLELCLGLNRPCPYHSLCSLARNAEGIRAPYQWQDTFLHAYCVRSGAPELKHQTSRSAMRLEHSNWSR
jgi:hypothetical protein